MNKTIAIILAALIAIIPGCTSTGDNAVESPAVSTTDSDVSPDTASETEITEKQPETPEEYHEAMVKRSLTSIGNPERIKAKIKQAESGEKTVVAYIGGSITEGYAGGADGCYAKLSYNYFAEAYGTGDNVEYVNAGLSGTASTVGNLRAQRDVLAYNPDIVFIEYAVNDAQDMFTKASYESLVKTFLAQENKPAVVLIFNRTVDGYTAQEYMKTIGRHYELPMVSVVDAITPEIDEGRMKWEDYSVDSAHPGVDGHSLISEFIEYMYKTAEATDSKPYVIPDDPIYGTHYANAVMTTLAMSNDELTVTDSGAFRESAAEGFGFPGSWEYRSGTAVSNEPFKLIATGSAFFLIYKTNNTDKMGSVDIYINGELAKTIDSHEEYGWGGAAAMVVAEYDTVGIWRLKFVPLPIKQKRKCSPYSDSRYRRIERGITELFCIK